MEFPQPTEQGFRRPQLLGLINSYSYSFLESRVTLCLCSLSALHDCLYALEVLLQGRSLETHPDLTILQVAKYRSSLVCICSIDRLSLMILLPGHDLDYLVHLLSILIIVISLKVGDLTGEFGFDDSYCDLSLVCDVQSWDTSPSTRFFEAAT